MASNTVLHVHAVTRITTEESASGTSHWLEIRATTIDGEEVEICLFHDGSVKPEVLPPDEEEIF